MTFRAAAYIASALTVGFSPLFGLAMAKSGLPDLIAIYFIMIYAAFPLGLLAADHFYGKKS